MGGFGIYLALRLFALGFPCCFFLHSSVNFVLLLSRRLGYLLEYTVEPYSGSEVMVQSFVDLVIMDSLYNYMNGFEDMEIYHLLI